MGFKERFHGIVIRAADRIFDRIPVDLVELRFQFDHGSGYIGIGSDYDRLESFVLEV